MAEVRVGEFVAMIDDRDWAIVSMFRWRPLTSSGDSIARTYARGRVGRGLDVSMHRLIMNPPAHLMVDHKDGNGLNNCRCNLRLCTASQNVHNRGLLRNNTSGYKGVVLIRKTGKWLAQISAHRKHYVLGYFETPELAHEAYKRAAAELHGEFAFTGARHG